MFSEEKPTTKHVISKSEICIPGNMHIRNGYTHMTQPPLSILFYDDNKTLFCHSVVIFPFCILKFNNCSLVLIFCRVDLSLLWLQV